MRIVYCGSSAFGLPCLEAIRNSRHELVHIITQPSKQAGRGKKLRKTPVADWADNAQIDCSEFSNVNSSESLELVASLKPDIFVVIAFGQKIGPEFIKSAKHEAINVHGSLLPDYRGAAPINWAIIDGKKETGVTIITLADRMDAGDMLGKSSIPIEPCDSASSIHDKLSEISAPLIIETLEKIESGAAIFQSQDESKVTIARKLNKSDGYIDFAQNAGKVVDLIRGMWAWPGAQSDYIIGESSKRLRVTIAQAKVVEIVGEKEYLPGEFDDNLNVVCGEKAIQISKIKPAGSSLMDFKSFLNGRKSGPLDKFITIDGGS